jgi:Gram-negative bacterial TonB protein C-terminal
MNCYLLKGVVLVIAAATSDCIVAEPSDSELRFPLGRTGHLCKEPIYPAAALRSETQGRTTVRFTVSESGEIVNAEVEVSAGDTREHKLLDQAFTAPRPLDDARLHEALLELLQHEGVVVYAPGSPPVIGSRASEKHLPEGMISALGAGVIVETGHALRSVLFGR